MRKFKLLTIFSILIVLVLAGYSSSEVYARQFAATSPGLGSADSFAVLGGSAVTDNPISTITGDVGLSPASGSFYSGLTSAEVSGTIYAVDSFGPAGSIGNAGLVNQAKNDLVTAYDNVFGQSTTTTFVDSDNQLGGQTLSPGVYQFGHGDTANLIDTLTLDAEGDPYAVFIFKATSDLIFASGSSVALLNGTQACNVWWQVSTSAIIGTSSSLVGNILALTSITDDGTSTIQGRLLARNGAVALNQTTITRPTCVLAPTDTEDEDDNEEDTTEEDTITNTNLILGLPATGGAPIQSDDFPWNLVIIGGIGTIPLILFVRDYLSKNLPKK